MTDLIGEDKKMEYIQQADKFLTDTKTEFKVELLKNDFYFYGDDKKRDIYTITLKRGSRVYKFTFGQSLNDSIITGTRKAPTSYDVLACLTKSPVGTFKDFCDDYGYDDEPNAHKIYKKVVDEWLNIERMYTTEEIKQLQEIN